MELKLWIKDTTIFTFHFRDVWNSKVATGLLEWRWNNAEVSTLKGNISKKSNFYLLFPPIKTKSDKSVLNGKNMSKKR